MGSRALGGEKMNIEKGYKTVFIYTPEENEKAALEIYKKFHLVTSIQGSISLSTSLPLIPFVFGSRNFLAMLILGILMFPCLFALSYAYKQKSVLRKAKQDQQMMAKNIENVEIEFEFFEEYVRIRAMMAGEEKFSEEYIDLKYNTYNINEIIETETNFYFNTNLKGVNSLLIIIKENCSLDLIDFIKNIPAKEKYHTESLLKKLNFSDFKKRR